MAGNDISVRVKSLQWECEDVLKIVLIPLEGTLPTSEPGAHVDVKVPGAPSRQYSLTATSTENAYVLGVRKDPKTRGGSGTIHSKLRPGDIIEISSPRNAFPLVEEGAVHLVAGGIGITPILFMAEQLNSSGREWSLSYFARSREHAAFLDEVVALGGKAYFDDEHGVPDMSQEIQGVSFNSHLYCCGPTPMLDAFVEACAERDGKFVHIERFAAAPLKIGEGEFIVELRKSGQELTVPSDKSVLEVLIDAGLDPSYNCQSGICGECEVQVLEGTPDHKDMILSDDEKATGSMLICCSRALSDRLVLDV